MPLTLIEPRKPTTEPLVEIELTSDGRDGPFVPAGRRFWEGANATGRNSYGLTDAEDVAFQNACDRLRGLPDQHYTDRELVAALVAAGLDSTASPEKRSAFVIEYRAKNPLPTSFAPLPAGHSSSNYASPAPTTGTPMITESQPPVVNEEKPIEQVAAPIAASNAIAHVDQLIPAVRVAPQTIGPNGAATEFAAVTSEGSHAVIPAASVNFLHGMLDAMKPSLEAAAQELAVMAFQAAFRKAFPKAAPIT